MKKWNDKNLEDAYGQIKKQALTNTKYDENLFNTPTLESWKFNTKSTIQWQRIELAYILGQMRAIKNLDDGENIISTSDTINNTQTILNK